MRGRGVSEFQLTAAPLFRLRSVAGGELLLSVFLWFWTSRRSFEEIFGRRRGWSDLGLEENERFFEGELGCEVEGKAEEGEGRLAGLARLASGGAGHQTSSCAGGGCDAKQCAPVAAEREKVAEAEEEEEMDVEALLQQHEELVESMLAEGLLDEQFSQLQQLQDETTPDFVEEVVALFFEDSERLLKQLTESLEVDPIDYKVVDSHVHQFKGSSSSIGAQQVKEVCITFRHCCDKEDKQGCLEALEKVKEEFNLVKSKLETMLELEKQIVAAGGTLPFMAE